MRMHGQAHVTASKARCVDSTDRRPDAADNRAVLLHNPHHLLYRRRPAVSEERDQQRHVIDRLCVGVGQLVQGLDQINHKLINANENMARDSTYIYRPVGVRG